MNDFSSGPWSMVATCSRGLEEVLAGELDALGASDVAIVRGAVSFSGTRSTLYDANLWLRSAIRVLLPLAEGRVSSRRELYQLAEQVAWEQLMSPRSTFLVDVAGRCQGIDNTVFAAQVVKDAVVDRFRRLGGGRPSVDRKKPGLRVNLHLAGDSSSLSLDSSGEPLSHRGYRPRGGPAPLSETLAAGLLLHAGYDGSSSFLDPLCGTGTIAIEAALIASHTAPGLQRGFACERWPGFAADWCQQLRRAAEARRRTPPAPILAWDSDPKAVKAASRNASAAGVGAMVTVERRDVAELDTAGFEPGVIVGNPPYGKRLGEVEELRGLYRTLGDRLKHHAEGWTAWLLMGERELAKEIGLRAARRIQVFNGPIECRFMRFDLYQGSKKDQHS